MSRFRRLIRALAVGAPVVALLVPATVAASTGAESTLPPFGKALDIA